MDPALFAYMAVAVNAIAYVIAIVVAALALVAFKKSSGEVSRAAGIFPTALEALNYSEIPISVVAVAADHMQISLDEVAQEYAKDASQRKSIVVQTFGQDSVTEKFLDGFPSKFLKEGYCGEACLQS